MRRRLERFIPIVLFAVLVQLLAPIGAFRAVAHVVSDPLAMAMTCSELATSGGRTTAPSPTSSHQGDCCVACAAGHVGSAATDAPPSVFVSLQRQYQRVVWREATGAMPAIRVGSNTQARAPPLLS